MKIAKIPLKPFSRFHLGEFKTDINVAISSTSSFAHSDTLFSALINCYCSKFQDTEEIFIKSFIDNDIIISSLYYYLESKNICVYLLPKPVFLDVYSPRDKQHKKRNLIQFISKGVWDQGFDTHKWINKNGNVEKDFKLIQNGEILLTLNEFNKLGLNNEATVFKIVDNPKSPIRKPHPKASIFYQTDVELSKIENVEIGLFYLYEANGQDEINLKNATNIMAYSGIGGEITNTGRTMGTPKFDDTINFNTGLNDFDSGHTNLSLLNPKDEDELNNIKYFKTIQRGGAGFDSIEYYRVVRMIKEGGLIKQKELNGRLVSIGKITIDRKEVDVWRNGKALIVPIMFKNTITG